MKKINVAIASFGYSSRVFHTPFLLTNSNFVVKKVFERSTEKALEYFPQTQIVREFEQLLTDEIDLVIITTPNQTHYEFAKQALLANKNVLIEKPLVPTAQQALELDQLAKERNLLLTVYQNRRWDSAVATAKLILEQGLIGEPVDCEIRFDRYAKTKNAKQWKETGEQGVGLVYDLGVHLLDQAVYLFGKPNAVFADVRHQHPDALSDDNFTIHLYYPSGLKVSLQATRYAREPNFQFALHGTLGSYLKKNADQQETKLAQGTMPVGDWYAEPESEWGILHTEQNDDVVRYAFPNAQTGYQDFYHNLYNALIGEETLLVTAEQATFVLDLIEKVYQSAKTGCKIWL